MGAWELSISKELSLVEKLLRETVTSPESLLTEIANYAIGAGGKRARPAVTILSFYAVGGEEVKRAIEIAAALELVHNATLIHDDINDGGTTRRGQVAAHRRYGLHNALVTGDFLFTKAFAIGGHFEPEIVDITAEACVRLAEGEVRQSNQARNLALTEREYLETIRLKTGYFFSAGARLGALLGGGSPSEIEAMGGYGAAGGMAFQMVDDILDVVGEEPVLGKPVGSDIREGNMTLLHIHALRKATPDARRELADILRTEDPDAASVRRALEIVRASGAVEAARARARELGERAKEHLGVLPPSPHKLDLMRLVDMVLERDR